MPSWSDFERSAPDLAASVRAIFEARKHHTLATLRADGAPRISGIEVEFRDDGELVLGMMPGSRKAADVARDCRLAVHGLSADPPPEDQPSWGGDAKIAGLGVSLGERLEEQPPGPRFRIDITEVVLTRIDGDGQGLVIQSWHPGRGVEPGRRQ